MDIKGRCEIGQWVLGSVMEPFLNDPFNLATLQSIRKTEFFIETLHISDIGFARTLTLSFKKIRDILSIRAVLCISIFLNNFKSRSSETSERLNLEG